LPYPVVAALRISEKTVLRMSRNGKPGCVSALHRQA